MATQQAIAVYTVLRILKNMRTTLGLEAMSEFLDSYVGAVERINPELKQEVNRALCDRVLFNLYEGVMSHEKK